jgi:hypothetical protein
MIYTFQDFEGATDKARFVLDAISTYKQSDLYRTALIADEYDAQRNTTINAVVPTLYDLSGRKKRDVTASNNKIAYNLFNRLNTQRCMYSLGNGVSFLSPEEAAKGKQDTTKPKLGSHFDHDIVEAGYYGLIHGVSYLFWDSDRAYVFKATEFVPLDDEYDGTMRAGIRFWQLADTKPLNAVLYEQDGFTTYRQENGEFREVRPKRAYKVTYQYTDSDAEMYVTSEENYAALPVVRLYGSRLKQSTLIGMREAIDAYDLIRSGFANDVTDCAQVYWIVENYGGMEDNDLAKFLDRLKLNHVANADTQAGGKITPYTQEIPTNARKDCLQELRNGIYEDFGALDVHTIAAGATNDHVDAAYQAMNDRAADFEHWVSDAIIRLLALQGIEDTPIFSRDKISNQLEQVEMVAQEAEFLDDATILRKLPNLSPEEEYAILMARQDEEMQRLGTGADDEGIEE